MSNPTGYDDEQDAADPPPATEVEAEPEAVAAPDERLVDPDLTVHVRVWRVLADLPAIGKNSRNVEDGYSFRGIDDALNALNPLLSKHGLFYVPTVLKIRESERRTQGGTAWYVTKVKVRYRFFGANGDTMDSKLWGEGVDTADKSLSKAMTAALKVMLFQVFAISTKDTADSDGDRRTPDDTVGTTRDGGGDKAGDVAWPWNGWESQEELADGFDPLYERMKALPPAHRALLKAWRDEHSVTMPPHRESIPALTLKVMELEEAVANPDAVEPTGVPDPEPDVDGGAPPADADAVASETDSATGAETADDADVEPPREAAEGEPAATDEPPAVEQPPAAPEAPEADSVRAAAEASMREAIAGTTGVLDAMARADEEGGKPRWHEGIECQGQYEGCNGTVENANQFDLTFFRWSKWMCKSCNRQHKAGPPAA